MGCSSSSCWSSLTSGTSVAVLSQHPLIPVSASVLPATRLGQGREMWPRVIASPRAVFVLLPARKRDGDARRGEALHPSLPSQHPALEQGNTPGPALDSSQGEGWLIKTKPHTPLVPSFERPYLLSPSPARARQTQDALFHTPNPSAPFGMSPASLTQGAAGRCGCLNREQLDHLLGNLKEMETRFWARCQPARS